MIYTACTARPRGQRFLHEALLSSLVSVQGIGCMHLRSIDVFVLGNIFCLIAGEVFDE